MALGPGGVGTGTGVTGAASSSWRRALPGWLGWLVVLVVATAWPWLTIVAWWQRGGLYFWAFALGCLLVVALAYVRIADERALRCVRGILGPAPGREADLTQALADAGIADAVPWLGTLDRPGPVALAAFGRRHVVVPRKTPSSEAEIAVAAAADLATTDPWTRPLRMFARAAWRAPLDVLLQWLRPIVPSLGSSGRDRDLDGRAGVDAVTLVVAFLSCGLTGFATAAALAAALGQGERMTLDPDTPWVTVLAFAVFGALSWLILAVWPSRWPEIRVVGAHRPGPDVPPWKGTDDERVLARNGAILGGRRSLVGLGGAFASWLAGSGWILWAPLGLAERYGWVASATLPFGISYLVLLVPAIWIGRLVFSRSWVYGGAASGLPSQPWRSTWWSPAPPRCCSGCWVEPRCSTRPLAWR